MRLVELQAEVFEKSSGHLGGGGVQIFTFVAKERGKGLIQFAYKRPWEASPLKQDHYLVLVE